MDRRDAIKELLKAGKRGEVMDVFARHGANAQRAFERIRSDSTISEDYRLTRLAQVQRQASRDVDADLDDAARVVIRIDNDDAGHVFGVKGLTGDPASLIISRRDAADRVAGINDSAELSDLLRRATRSGDEVLARAIAERATELQNADVMNTFLAARPELEKAGERLWNVEQAERPTFDIAMLGATQMLQAAEMADYRSDQVESFAEGEMVNREATRSIFDSTSAAAEPMPAGSAFVSSQGSF